MKFLKDDDLSYLPMTPEEFQELLHTYYVWSESNREVARARLFGYWFTFVGLATAGALYLIKFEHWFGVR